MTQVIRLDTVFAENTGNAKVLTALGNPYLSFDARAYSHLANGAAIAEPKANGLAKQPKTSFIRAGGVNNVAKLNKQSDGRCFLELVGTTLHAPLDLPLNVSSITFLIKYQTNVVQTADSIRMFALKYAASTYALALTPLSNPKGNIFGVTTSPSTPTGEFADNVFAVHVKSDGTMWIRSGGVTTSLDGAALPTAQVKYLQIGGSTAKLDSTTTVKVEKTEIYTDLNLSQVEFDHYADSL